MQQKLRRDAESALAVLRSDLEAAKPDVLIVVANDQFVNFFFDNIPTFFVTLADEVEGQFTRHKFHYRNHRELGRAILQAGVAAGLDLSFGEDIELQHTQMVPLHFLLPRAGDPDPAHLRQYLDRSVADARPVPCAGEPHKAGGGRRHRAGGHARHRRPVAFPRVPPDR